MPILNIFKKKEKPTKAKKEKAKAPVVKKEVKLKKEAKPQKAKISDKAYRVLVKPLITEKATNLQALGKYVFKVALDATKQEIKRAIEEVYGVEPMAVHTIKVFGKQRRYQATKGKTSAWKKAIVTLKPGEKIEIVEGV